MILERLVVNGDVVCRLLYYNKEKGNVLYVGSAEYKKITDKYAEEKGKTVEENKEEFLRWVVEAGIVKQDN